ncbi:hypothetical protein KAI60_04940, partial [Candidatus Bathyarchaeota archaeon]|nr:hypothetical protein [Candidatus Bathyarchaeota archaeon]
SALTRLSYLGTINEIPHHRFNLSQTSIQNVKEKRSLYIIIRIVSSSVFHVYMYERNFKDKCNNCKFPTSS